ncbi:Glutathione gamma-glutamylcysteinyltransferase [Diplonema papillatum]|nr:Glutathione gamma-glutamylcysteinyltransferase [Diplonema papillatum]|eukprot:gene10647-16384_t
MPKRPAVVQFYRSMRDAWRHKRLASRLDRQPLPAQLTDAESEAGRELFEGSARNACLAACFEKQQHPAFCGLATCCVVLRSLGVHVTQASIFDVLSPEFPEQWFAFFGFAFADRLPQAVKVALNEHLKYDGLPLNAARRLLEAHGMRVDTVGCSAGVTAESLLRDLRPTLHDGSRVVLVANYDRPTLGQRGTGHFAPVAAYHEAARKCLVLDVNWYRYPSVWLDVELLVQAFQPLSPGGTRRGYMLVSKPAEKHTASAA